MAHAIDMSNNRSNMAFVGQTPWHGLGQQLTPGASIETWAKEAGMEWDIERAAVRYETDAKILDMPERHVLYRSDTHKPLSIVSESYKVVQPKEVLEFYRDLVDVAGFSLDTAGSLFGGRKVWALARVADDFRLKGQDAIKGYLLLATSCDGSFATRAQFTTVRVVCNNTLQMAHEVRGTLTMPSVSIPHSRQFDAKQVKQQLGIGRESWEEFKELADKLASTRITQGVAEEWLIKTFGDPELPLNKQPKATTMRRVWESVANSPGSSLRSAHMTAWGLVNGVTHYFDHARPTRTKDARLDTAWFGEGAQMKVKAIENILRIAA